MDCIGLDSAWRGALAVVALEVVRVEDLAAHAQELRLLDGLFALEALQAVLAALALAQVTLAAQRPALTQTCAATLQATTHKLIQYIRLHYYTNYCSCNYTMYTVDSV